MVLSPATMVHWQARNETQHSFSKSVSGLGFPGASLGDLLTVLGADLPGAVRVVLSEGTLATEDGLKDTLKARFSLAGVQMKLSVMKNTGKGGGLTLPMDDEQGRYIAKFPSPAFPGVSENEFANLALAAAIGMDVPERELVEKSDFDGIPEEFDTLSEGRVLLVKTLRSRR